LHSVKILAISTVQSKPNKLREVAL